jgi:hypothetical protein
VVGDRSGRSEANKKYEFENNQPFSLMKTSFICLAAIVLCACSTRHQTPNPAQPDAVWWMPEPDSNDRSITKVAMECAVRSGDNDVALAAEYNQLHVVVAQENEDKANAALQALKTVGDDYSIAWLQSLEHRSDLSHRAERFAATRASIHLRLQNNPVPPARQVQERFLRAGVARLCNPLELTLPAFTSRWAQDQLNAPGVRSELARFSEANHSEAARSRTMDQIVRDLAANLAKGLPKWQPMFR